MTPPRPSERTCRLCTLSTPRKGRRLAFDEATVVASVNARAIVLVRPEARDVLVAPPAHVARLLALPPPEMAQLLAALRQVGAVLHIDEGDVRLKTVELPGSQGHMCIRVAPRPGSGASAFDPDAQLADHLRDVLSTGH